MKNKNLALAALGALALGISPNAQPTNLNVVGDNTEVHSEELQGLSYNFSAQVIEGLRGNFDDYYSQLNNYNDNIDFTAIRDDDLGSYIVNPLGYFLHDESEIDSIYNPIQGIQVEAGDDQTKIVIKCDDGIDIPDEILSVISQTAAGILSAYLYNEYTKRQQSTPKTPPISLDPNGLIPS